MIYTIRHCFLDDSLVQTIDTDSGEVRRTDHQLMALVEISERDDFAYFITSGGDAPVVIYPEYHGVYTVSWCSKDGTHSTVTLHPTNPHRYTVNGKHRPADILSPVYAARRHLP